MVGLCWCVSVCLWKKHHALSTPNNNIIEHDSSSAYRKYILPLLPTFATVNWRPSRPAEPPSGVMSVFMSSASFLALRFILFSLRKPSCNCFFLINSGELVPAALDRGAGARVIPFLGCLSTSRTVVSIRLGLGKRPRGERRSRCRCRRLSGV